MQRVHLEEDLHLIQKYFPGAQSVALHTPFDLTDRPPRTGGILPDTFRDDEPGNRQFRNYGGFSWSR